MREQKRLGCSDDYLVRSERVRFASATMQICDSRVSSVRGMRRHALHWRCHSGARRRREPGIQKWALNPHLDSGSGAGAPSRN